MAILNDGISHAHQSGDGFLKVLVDPPDANVEYVTKTQFFTYKKLILDLALSQFTVWNSPIQHSM